MKASDFIYCPQCNVERSPFSLIKRRRKEITTVCTNPLTGGYLEPYKYEDQLVIIYEFLCPRCKKALKDYRIEYNLGETR